MPQQNNKISVNNCGWKCTISLNECASLLSSFITIWFLHLKKRKVLSNELKHYSHENIIFRFFHHLPKMNVEQCFKIISCSYDQFIFMFKKKNTLIAMILLIIFKSFLFSHSCIQFLFIISIFSTLIF